MDVNGILKFNWRQEIQISIFVCFRLDFVPLIEFHRITPTVNQETSYLVHCKQYRMDIERKRNIPAKSFDKTSAGNFVRYNKFQVVILTVRQRTFLSSTVTTTMCRSVEYRKFNQGQKIRCVFRSTIKLFVSQ